VKSREELKEYYLSNPEAGEHILSYLQELLGGDKEDISLMLEFYYEELEDTKEQISAAIANSDYTEIFKGAHKLKGSLGNVGLFEEQNLMIEIEALSKDEEDNLAKIKSLYDAYLEIAEKNERLIQEAKQLI